MRLFAWWLLASFHLLAAAAWFGAMVYNLIVLHPGAKRFFGDIDKFEEFIATIGQGARWKVLSGLGLIAVSGAAMIPLARPAADSDRWDMLMVAKTILLLAAVILFWYASWRLWPKRIFASGEEAEMIQRQFRIVAICMICIAAAAMVLGVGAHIV